VLAPLVLLLLNAEPSVQLGSTPVTAAELEKLGAVTAEWKDHDAARQSYGVPLTKVLDRMGLVPGDKKSGHAGWKKVLVASGVDGYRAVFSAAELAEAMSGATRALLAWKLDGKPLPREQGAFRLVVPTDKDGARCVYQLARLELVDVP
jgi:DMSO/TMAO reductase YedYZ molybdopterin-dependent catalytic subunit